MGLIVHRSFKATLSTKGLTFFREVLLEQKEINKRYLEKLRSTKDITIIPKVDPILDLIKTTSEINVLPHASSLSYEYEVPAVLVNFEEIRHLMTDLERDEMDRKPPAEFHTYNGKRISDKYKRHEVLEEMSSIMGYKSKYWFSLSYSQMTDEKLKYIPKATLDRKNVILHPIMHLKDPSRMVSMPLIANPSFIGEGVSKLPFVTKATGNELNGLLISHQKKHNYRTCVYFLSKNSNNMKDLPVSKNSRTTRSFTYSKVKRTYYNIEHIRKPMPEDIVAKIKEYLAKAVHSTSGEDVDHSNPSLLLSSSVNSLCIDGISGEDLSHIPTLYNSNFKNKVFFNVDDLLKSKMLIFPNSLPIALEIDRDDNMFYTNIDEREVPSSEMIFFCCWDQGVGI